MIDLEEIKKKWPSTTHYYPLALELQLDIAVKDIHVLIAELEATRKKIPTEQNWLEQYRDVSTSTPLEDI